MERRRVLRPIRRDSGPTRITAPMITQRTAQAGVASVDKAGHTQILASSDTAKPIRIRR